MLTTFDLDGYVYEALRAGASGFLLKDATAADLIHAVQVIAAAVAPSSAGIVVLCPNEGETEGLRVTQWRCVLAHGRFKITT
jgi:DNA-binding NarL/FixJ family response regulator